MTQNEPNSPSFDGIDVMSNEAIDDHPIDNADYEEVMSLQPPAEELVKGLKNKTSKLKKKSDKSNFLNKSQNDDEVLSNRSKITQTNITRNELMNGKHFKKILNHQTKVK